MASKKAGGSSTNGRDSIAKRLGVKLFGGQKAKHQAVGGAPLHSLHGLLNVLGWSWHRFPMKCSITNEVVVFLQRAFVAIDHTGKYRKIYSPGSLVPFGFIIMQGLKGFQRK